MDSEQAAVLEPTEADPTTPESTEEVKSPPDFNALGQEFNAKVADLLTEFDNQLPYIFMAKILQNLAIDLIAQQNAMQAQYVMEQIIEQAKKNAAALATEKSSIVRV